jgi:hypothetical protein
MGMELNRYPERIRSGIHSLLVAGTLASLAAACASSKQEQSAIASEDQSPTPPSNNGLIVSIPFRLVANKVMIAATINGTGPFWLGLDSGDPLDGLFLFEDERVLGLKLPLSHQTKSIFGSGGHNESSDAKMASGVDVSLGGLELPHIAAYLWADTTGVPPDLDGVIGAELFDHYVIRIDADKHLMQLFDPSIWTPPTDARGVALEESHGFMFATASVTMEGQERQQVTVFIDLGQDTALKLVAGGDSTLRLPSNTIESPLGRGASGIEYGKVGRAVRVELGHLAFENVIVGFPNSNHIIAGAQGLDGSIGFELLKRCNPTFDYVGKRLLLEPASGSTAPFEWQMCGIAFEWQANRGLRIVDIIANSPAAEAGIRVGDWLRAIDGVTVDSLGRNEISEALLTEGAERVLVLERDQQTIKVRVRLRRLI